VQRISGTAAEAQRLAEEDPQAALIWAAQQPAELTRVAVQAVLQAWASRDSTAAFKGAVALDNSDAGLRTMALALTREQWGGRIPQRRGRVSGSISPPRASARCSSWTS